MRDLERFLPVILAFVAGGLVGLHDPSRWGLAFLGGGLVMLAWLIVTRRDGRFDKGKDGRRSHVGHYADVQSRSRSRNEPPLYEERA